MTMTVTTEANLHFAVAMTNNASSAPRFVPYHPLLSRPLPLPQTANTMKAGKTSRAGAKAGRVVKIVRLIRFVRIFKLMKLRKQAEDDVETTDEGKSLELKLEEEPSKVGKKVRRGSSQLAMKIAFFNQNLIRAPLRRTPLVAYGAHREEGHCDCPCHDYDFSLP